MPLISEQPVGVNSRRLPEPQEPAKGPSGLDVAAAALRRENSVGSYFARKRDVFEASDDEFDITADIEGYETHADRFIWATTQGQANQVKAAIDREARDMEVLRQGGAMSLAAQIASGTVDPLMLPLLAAPAVKASGAVRTAVATALGGGTGAAVSEVALQSTQETRTTIESLFNVSAATLLSGVLGGAIGALGDDFARTAKLVADDFDSDSAISTAGAAMVRGTTLEQETLAGSAGVAKLLKPINPVLRTMQSASRRVRQVSQELAENNFTTRKNAEGVENVTAVETLIKREDGEFATAVTDTASIIKAYKARMKAGGHKALNPQELREQIGMALRRGDQHQIPEVAQAAGRWRQFFDRYKQQAVREGLLPEDVNVVGADSYLHRVYRTDRIANNQADFEDRLVQWMRSEAPDADVAELRTTAAEITRNITSHPAGLIPRDVVPTASPLKDRVLRAPDELLEPYLESDIEVVGRQYLRSMAPEIQLTRRFGDKDMRAAFQQITDEYDVLVEGKSPKQVKQLRAKQADDIEDLQAMRDRLTGTYRMPANPDSGIVKANRLLRDYNFLRMLGGMTVSALPDVANIVMAHGLKGFTTGVKALASGPRLSMARAELRRMGVGLDMLLNSRAQAMAEVGEFTGDALLRGSRRLSDNFAKLTLMAPWNATMKQWVGLTVSDAILDGVIKVSRGTSNAKLVTKLARSGINEDMAKRIAKQFAEHGDDGTLRLPQSFSWTDREAAEVFQSAILKDVDTAIVTPGVGDKPLWTSSEAGKTIGQFKSFAFAATNRILVSRLQQKDAAAASGMLLSLALGGLVYGTKAKLAGREISDDPGTVLREAIDRSGMTGFMSDGLNIMESFWGYPLLGEQKATRYASRNAVGALLGPSFGTAEDMRRVIQASSGAVMEGEEFSEGDRSAVRRLIPYQNLFYVQQLMNKMAEAP